MKIQGNHGPPLPPLPTPMGKIYQMAKDGGFKMKVTKLLTGIYRYRRNPEFFFRQKAEVGKKAFSAGRKEFQGAESKRLVIFTI